MWAFFVDRIQREMRQALPPLDYGVDGCETGLCRLRPLAKLTKIGHLILRAPSNTIQFGSNCETVGSTTRATPFDEIRNFTAYPR